MRVYCDFKNGKGAFYAYFGKTHEDEPYIGKAESYVGIHDACARIGLFPVDLQTED
jgi:hypothetical protein